MDNCLQKCRKKRDCVAISIKQGNNACTGFTACPFFEDTANFGRNEGFISVRVKPDPVAASEAFVDGGDFRQPVEERGLAAPWMVERGLAVLGLLSAVYHAFAWF